MKRLLAALILSIVLIAVGSPASAQTATPTPGPICGPGYYEQTSSCVIYSANWSTASNAVYSGGSLVSTTTIGANLQFRMYGTTLVIYRTIASTGTTANFCVDASCQTISFNNGTTVNMASLSYEVDCLSVCNVSITHNGSGGSGINLDSFAIFWNDPTATPVTPLATWTSQVITPLPTWTNQVVTALPTWTAPASSTGYINGQYIFPNLNGFAEDTDAGITYSGSWALDSDTATWSGGYAHTTTSYNAYFTFTVHSATLVQLQMYGTPSTDDLLVCVSGNACQTVTGDRGTPQTFSVSSDFSSPNLYSVLVKKATNDSAPIYFDRINILGFETPTPSVTPTPILPLTQIPYFTQIPPLTAEPQFTQIPPLTAEPQFTQIPPLTAEPQFTQIPPLTAEPQFTQIPPFTQIPFPTPLDTWTAQPDVVVTFSGTVVAAIDWNGFLTIYPTLVSPIPPTSTPTETLTPSITPTTTPLGYMQIDLPDAQGTTIATGTLYMQATAGEVGNMVLLFFLSLIGLVFIVRTIFESRKSPI